MAEDKSLKVFFDALILAGGRGSRLEGVDKAALLLENERLVDRVIAATRRAGVSQVVIVGPTDAGAHADLVVREEPPFSGPLAAVGRGIEEIEAPWVMLLACDLQHPDQVVDQLLSALLNVSKSQQSGVSHQKIQGVVLSDESGNRQWLASCINTAVLRDALDSVLREKGSLDGGSLAAVFGHIEFFSAVAHPGSTQDIDTPEQLAHAQQQIERKEDHEQ